MYGNVGMLAWALCYILVLLGLSFYGLHRYFIIYLYFRHRKRNLQPLARFAELPVVTVQLPIYNCLLYTSPSPRDLSTSRMPSSA